jgi:Ulp1 family protease
MSEKERKECRTLKLQMRKRGVEKSETTSKSHTAKKRRHTLGDSNNNQHHPRKQEGSIVTPIVILESESEEGKKVNGQSITRGMTNLMTLTKKDLQTIEGRVNDACINALSDILHKKLTHKRISICHTQFFIALKERGWLEASRYVQWDPNSPISERWHANKYAQAHITSEILIIPCHFPGHWALALRVILPTGKHVLHVLDSLGRCNVWKNKRAPHRYSHSQKESKIQGI